jgi:hypothetical protein
MGGERRRRTGNICEENEDTGDESHNCEWKIVGRVYGLSEREGWRGRCGQLYYNVGHGRGQILTQGRKTRGRGQIGGQNTRDDWCYVSRQTTYIHKHECYIYNL